MPVVIEAVADDKFVLDLETGPVGVDGDFVRAALFEEDADFHVGGAEFLQARGESGEGAAGIEDVVDDEDVAARHGFSQGVEAAYLAGAFGSGIAGEPDAGDFDVVEVDGAEKVGQKEEGAVHDAEENGAFTAIVAGDAFSELPDACADLRLGEKNATEFHGPRKALN